MGLVEVILPVVASLCLNYKCENVTGGQSFYLEKNGNDTSVSRSVLRPQPYVVFKELREQIKYETFVVTTLSNGPLSGYFKENGSYVGRGVAFDVFNIIQKLYGFNYIVVPPNSTSFDPDEEDGLRPLLINGNVDVVVAFLPEKYNDQVNYSKPLDIAEWRVLMKRPKESATGSGLLAPFTATVWSLIIISLLGVGPILWLIIIFRARMCKEDNDVVFSLPACMWFVYGALLKQGSTLNPRTDSSRILFSTWWIFITILTAFYTANLTAFLTLSQFTLPISEPKDISRKNYKWITNKGNGIIEQLSSSNSSLLYDIGSPLRKVNEETEYDILTRYVTEMNHMYIREKSVLETIMYEDYKNKTRHGVDEPKRCTYVLTQFPVCKFPRSFAFRRGFKYITLFNSAIQQLMQAGIIEFKHTQFLPDTVICPLNLGSKERRLRNSDLAMTYMIIGGGLVVSTVIFAIELVIHLLKRHRCCKKRRTNNIPVTSSKVFSTHLNTDFHSKNTKNSEASFVTPPPSYHTLFNHPPIMPGLHYRKKTINGREYWVVNDKQGGTSLIPQRAPSALLFQFTN
ncbi:glutamate receptor ionotropic, delta-2 [Euwallacea fornicatus]|uniref:glutamate receptor ionotropic, delta-2 n=1 Tax=Euwallacea fornicatus TaxID=995702 RepID=UPI00338F8E6F